MQKEVNGLSPEGCTVFGYASGGVLRERKCMGTKGSERVHGGSGNSQPLHCPEWGYTLWICWRKRMGHGFFQSPGTLLFNLP